MKVSGAPVLLRSGYVLATQVTGLACSVVSGFLIAWMLGPTGKGLVYLVQTTASVGLILFNFGLGPSAIYHLGSGQRRSAEDVASTLLLPSLLLGVGPAALAGLAWPWGQPFLTAKLAAPYLWLALAAVPALTLTFNAGYLCLGLGWIGRYNLLSAATGILFSAFLVAAALAGHRSIGTITGLWALSIAVPAFYGLALVRCAGASWLPRAKEPIGEVFRFGWHSHLGAVTQYLQHRIDILLVAFMLPLRSLGVYSIAIGLAEVLWNVPQSIAPVLMPHVADSTEAKANRATSQFCRLALAGGALLAVGLAFAASIIIPRILPEFRQSVVLVWFLLPGTVAASVFKVLASDFNGRGRPIQTFYPAAIALVACAVAGVLIVPRYGLRGEALVTTGGYLLNSTLYIFAYRRMTATRVLDLFFINSDDLRDARAACVAAWGVLSAHRPSRAIAWAEPPTDSL